MPKPSYSIQLSPEEQRDLESILRMGTAEARLYRRAKMLLLKSEGMSINRIAQKLDVTIPTVRLCLEKFREGGIDMALEDFVGRGRKSEIADDAKLWLINLACQKPTAFGLSAELWNPTSLTRYVNSIAEESGFPRMSTITVTTVRNILRNANLEPHKVIYYCEKRDPDFDAKMHDVLVIYKQLELNFDENGELIAHDETVPFTHTLSYDEKPGIQAISCTGEDKPPLPNTEKNGTVKRDYEYIRLGTVSLLAAIDLLSGKAIPHISDTHASADFVCFLKKLDAEYPKQDRIRLILDNHSAHTSMETQQYLNTIPGRFEFVFTPTHGSWLNMIEAFFSKMTRQTLKEIRVKTKDELISRILLYFDEINAVPVPYRWKYKMDSIDLNKEDVSTIACDVVNAKAATIQYRKAPKTRKQKLDEQLG